MPLLRDDLQPNADVEDRRALRRRAQRGEVVPPLVRPRELAGALGDVERDGGRGARELVGDVAAAAGEVLDDVGREGEEVEGGLVDEEALVEEGHGRGAYRRGEGEGEGRGQRAEGEGEGRRGQRGEGEGQRGQRGEGEGRRGRRVVPIGYVFFRGNVGSG